MKCKFNISVINGCLHRKLVGTWEVSVNRGDPYLQPTTIAALVLDQLGKTENLEGHRIVFTFSLPKKKTK
jgi:hypothetical protein